MLGVNQSVLFCSGICRDGIDVWISIHALVTADGAAASLVVVVRTLNGHVETPQSSLHTTVPTVRFPTRQVRQELVVHGHHENVDMLDTAVVQRVESRHQFVLGKGGPILQAESQGRQWNVLHVPIHCPQETTRRKVVGIHDQPPIQGRTVNEIDDLGLPRIRRWFAVARTIVRWWLR